MSSAGKEIIGWRWLEAAGMTGECPPIPLWGWCPWKPVVEALRRGHSTITNAPLMPVNDRWVTMWFVRKGKKTSLSRPFFSFSFSYKASVCLTRGRECSLTRAATTLALARRTDRIWQPHLSNKALLKWHVIVRVLPSVQRCVESCASTYWHALPLDKDGRRQKGK